MTTRRRPATRLVPLAAATAAAALAWHLTTSARQAPGPRSRFEFAVVESFDAKYLGDTPGHTGRGGDLGRTAPSVAIGDPVYSGEAKVGTVSRLTWDRAHESLEVEFDPEPKVRITIGQAVWVALDGRRPAPAPGR